MPERKNDSRVGPLEKRSKLGLKKGDAALNFRRLGLIGRRRTAGDVGDVSVPKNQPVIAGFRKSLIGEPGFMERAIEPIA